MGYGRSFVCSKCQKEYRAGWGVGFLFPEEYNKTLFDIRNGKYGEEMKSILCNEKHIAVDAEKYIYVCKKCGAWKVEKGAFTLCPKEREIIDDEALRR